jgi:hypothetical protein
MHDKYHAHEALDRCSIVVGMIDDLLITHPFVVDHPEILAKLEHLAEELAQVYQDIGTAGHGTEES